MKSCELCDSPARMYCESDLASLCWDCDAKVHSANFLVARHSRSLLCRSCQSPTAWSASGPKLAPTVSVCQSCARGCDRMGDGSHGTAASVEEESEGDNSSEIETDDEDELSAGDENGDNQVVPWSSTPPPPASSSSSSDHQSSSKFYSGDRDVSVKRFREDDPDLLSDDDDCCSSSHTKIRDSQSTKEEKMTFVDLTKPLKSRRTETNRSTRSRSTPIVESLKKFHDQQKTAGAGESAAIARISRLSKTPRAVDL